MLSVATLLLLATVVAGPAFGHEHAGDPSVFLAAQGPHKEHFWYNNIPGDGGTQVNFPAVRFRDI